MIFVVLCNRRCVVSDIKRACSLPRNFKLYSEINYKRGSIGYIIDLL